MLNDNQTFWPLISQSQILEDKTDWHREAFNDIESRLNDVDFPCVFSKRAFRKNIIKFIFVENVEESGIQHLGDGLKAYVEISKRWDGDLGTAYPLIVVFSKKAVSMQSVDDYHSFGWMILQRLHDIDTEPWPDDVGVDPNSSSWSMCFNGMPLFFNMSTPANRVRRSRNLGSHFIFVINPRERFDVFAGNTPNGYKVRENIRNRIKRYDGVTHSSQLGSYGAGTLEWWQYGLIEENVERKDQCPFRFKKK